MLFRSLKTIRSSLSLSSSSLLSSRISLSLSSSLSSLYQIRYISEYVLSDNTIGINRLEKSNQLKELLLKNGAIISPSISLHDYTYQSQGLGLRANNHIKKYETIASIPLSLTISYANPYISSQFDDNNNNSNNNSNSNSKAKPKVLA